MYRSMTIEEFNKGLKSLKANEWYWEMDNDYRDKYRIVKDIIITENLGEDNWAYGCSLLTFLLEANNRIFNG